MPDTDFIHDARAYRASPWLRRYAALTLLVYITEMMKRLKRLLLCFIGAARENFNSITFIINFRFKIMRDCVSALRLPEISSRVLYIMLPPSFCAIYRYSRLILPA